MSACESCGTQLMLWTLGASTLQRCPACGHLRRDLVMAPARHRDHAYGGDPALDTMRQKLTYRSLVADGVPRSVFEVGYGAGSLLRAFHDAGTRIAGADPDQLQQGVDPVVSANGTLHHCGIEEVPEDSARYAMVYGIHVLEHVVDPAETLSKTARLLEPGGSAHFFTPAGDWAALPFVKDGWWMLEDPTHIRFYTAASLERMALDAGFTSVEIRRPPLDSLANDVVSTVRRIRPRELSEGVLARRSTMALAAAALPFTLPARLAYPRLRPTLHLVARTAS